IFSGTFTVNCDSGAVAIGDQLVISNVADGAARALNTNTDSRITVGRALSTKTAGDNAAYVSHDTGTEVITVNGTLSTWAANQRVVMMATGTAAIANLTSGTAYYVIAPSGTPTTTFQLATSSGGSAIDLGAYSGTGTIAFEPTATVSVWLTKATLSPVGQANTWTGNQTFSNGTSGSGVITIKEDADDGVNEATFAVPALASDTDYLLPVDDGDANEFLQTDGVGVLSWVAALTAEVDGVVGNEVTSATDGTLTLSGSGTGVSPYTLGLMNSVPMLDQPVPESKTLQAIPGIVPNLLTLPEGCSFRDRCSRAVVECRRARPPLVEAKRDHWVRCWRHADG
ncbi:MAG: hypothetical protein MUC98_16305, partial [Desulfobacterota bacterium]|nr:hypothetical protein [Thermodesulfobacteriota bacterium]